MQTLQLREGGIMDWEGALRAYFKAVYDCDHITARDAAEYTDETYRNLLLEMWKELDAKTRKDWDEYDAQTKLD